MILIEYLRDVLPAACGEAVNLFDLTHDEQLRPSFDPQLSDSSRKERMKMKLSTDDKTSGKLHEVKGTIKQTVGELTNDPNLEDDGREEKIAGKIQNLAGKVEKVLGK
jgi:uncharacterized protein YjbJ (UPF0337 family)